MNYPSIRIEGAILSPDIFDRLDDALGQRSVDFGLESSIKVKDEIARAWADAQDYWRIFQRKLESLKAHSPATSETRNNWIVPLLGLLGYQLEYQTRGTELDGKNYPLSHRVTNRAQTPVHIVGYNEPSGLDRKQDRAALRMSAHAMAQEYLNVTDQLFGVVTNGRVLRLLRDSSRLIKLSYLEFDLDRIFSDGLFADFAMLYRLLHASRLPQTVETSSTSWLERYHQDTIEQGTRIREGLRVAVREALEIFGTGFLSHPDNSRLRHLVATNELEPAVYFNHVLRLVYRLLFLMVAEERRLIFPKETPVKNVQLYVQHYSVQRLRRMASTRGLKIDRFHDAWLSLLSTFRLFEDPVMAAKLGMIALAGELFHPDCLGPLASSRLNNAALFDALDRLSNFKHPKSGQWMAVNFGALATEEFGSVYESLLELHPIVEITPTAQFGFKQAAGNERKTSGSYYTPSSLVDCLLDSALDPVLNDRIQNFVTLGFKSVDDAILALKVCDPACGSGHFLIAAAQRIARRLAISRAGDEEPGPELQRHALREVIGHCIYGVDINRMSVELCKVGLWIEALEPGKPLSFLDHHIQCGNSLLGVTPALLKNGIPDGAFAAIEGDVKAHVATLKKQNKKERDDRKSGQRTFSEPFIKQGNLAAELAHIDDAPDDTPDQVAEKQRRYAEFVKGQPYQFGRLLADTWCAAFVWKKDDSDLGKLCPTERDFRNVESHAGADLLPHVRTEIERLRDQYQFFHWNLAFPDVFRLPGNDESPENQQTGWSSGFDVILGNPPWERIRLLEREWFAERRPDIADAGKASTRRKMIEILRRDDHALHELFLNERRKAEAESHFMRESGRYPLCGRGDINTYMVFAETNRLIVADKGRIGCIVPSGIATDDTTKHFFREIAEAGTLVSLYDFENRSGLFPAVDSRMKFCLLTLFGYAHRVSKGGEFAFFLNSPEQILDSNRRFIMTADDIALLNPNSRTCPIFRCRRDAEITKAFCIRVPVFVAEGPNKANRWQVSMQRMIHMTDHSDFFRTTDQLIAEGFVRNGNIWVQENTRYLPLYEAKMIHHFDHLWNQGEDEIQEHHSPLRSRSPDTEVVSRFWIPESLHQDYIPQNWRHKWFLGWRDITNTTNERTVIAAVLPWVGIGNTIYELFPEVDQPALCAFLVANLSTMALDYVARQKVGGTHLTHGYMMQLPILPPTTYQQHSRWTSNSVSLASWLLPRVLELTYTTWNLEPFARDCGYAGPPFRWDEERRFRLRAELDAAFFHLYGIEHDDTAYILDTFPIVRRKDEQKYDGDYRTKRVILEIFDAMQTAIRTGQPYQTPLAPPPGPPTNAEGIFIPFSAWTDEILERYKDVVHLSESKNAEGSDGCLDEGVLPAVSYPGPGVFDRSLCSAALQIVDQIPEIESAEHLDTILLASHPEFCIPFLNAEDASRLEKLKEQVKYPFRAEEGRSVRWTECRDYLEQLEAIEINRNSLRQPIGKGTKFDDAMHELSTNTKELVELAVKALNVIRNLRKNGDESSVVRRRVIEQLDKARRQFGLAV